MDTHIIESFTAWLETAQEEEIIQKQGQFLRAFALVKTRALRADVLLGLRLIREELQVRSEILKQKRS